MGYLFHLLKVFASDGDAAALEPSPTHSFGVEFVTTSEDRYVDGLSLVIKATFSKIVINIHLLNHLILITYEHS